jgi:outer membrane protein assembly factor BamB
MKTLLALLTAVSCQAADWTCAVGEQKYEKLLNIDSVGKLQVVVKRRLADEPLGAPVMVGRQVTHKGIKDLVFVASSSSVYAVDPDLATLFWERRTAINGIATLVLGFGNGPKPDDDDAGDDISFSVRPLYLVQKNGKFDALNANSGGNLAVSSQLPKDVARCAVSAKNSDMAIANGVLFKLVNPHSKPALVALDAATGRELYRSKDEIEAPVDSSGLAIANGHVCFGDTKGTLYCFGFPVDL